MRKRQATQTVPSKLTIGGWLNAPGLCMVHPSKQCDYKCTSLLLDRSVLKKAISWRPLPTIPGMCVASVLAFFGERPTDLSAQKSQAPRENRLALACWCVRRGHTHANQYVQKCFLRARRSERLRRRRHRAWRQELPARPSISNISPNEIPPATSVVTLTTRDLQQTSELLGSNRFVRIRTRKPVLQPPPLQTEMASGRRVDVNPPATQLMLHRW